MLRKLRDMFTVYRAWEKALADAGVPNNHAPQFFDVLHRYGESQRFYHTIIHIAACLRFLDQTYDIHPQKRAALRLALIYHDIIYDVKSKTNEADSAAHARVQMTIMGFSKTYIDEVSRLILLTASHKAPPGDSIASIMIDTDMHVLAWDERDYLRYAGQIWQEYSYVGRDAYIAGRTHFLLGLDPDTVFTTPEVNIERMISNVAWNRHLELDILRDNPAEIMGT